MPTVPGGSSNDYDYARQDPINNFDLDGRMCWRHCHIPGWGHIKRFVKRHRYAIVAGVFIALAVASGGTLGILAAGLLASEFEAAVYVGVMAVGHATAFGMVGYQTYKHRPRDTGHRKQQQRHPRRGMGIRGGVSFE